MGESTQYPCAKALSEGCGATPPGILSPARKGETGEAVEHLETALRLEPDYADARRELARLRGTDANAR